MTSFSRSTSRSNSIARLAAASSSRARCTRIGTMGWKPSGPVISGMWGRDDSRGGFRMSMQSRMSEWQKNIVMARRAMMKRMWISWPREWFVRAIARSGVTLVFVRVKERMVGMEGTYKSLAQLVEKTRRLYMQPSSRVFVRHARITWVRSHRAGVAVAPSGRWVLDGAFSACVCVS